MTKLNGLARRSVRLFCLLTLPQWLAAQEAPTILVVEVENWVNYVNDLTDPTKLAKSPGPVERTPMTNFFTNIGIGDVTAINGSPAKGLMAMQNQALSPTPTPTPGQAISDVTRGTCVFLRFEFLKPDGSQIGSIFAMGLAGGTPPPGSPLGSGGGNNAIVGGTGAYVGATGTLSSRQGSASRNASQAEDPSMRRTNGGGRGTFLIQIWPASRPEIVLSPAGPTVFHGDFSPVTADKPAQKGETLIVYAKGLGPTIPTLNPGDTFPSEPLAVATSPVEVVVDGKASPAINQVGIPGTTDMYRVDFRMPDTAPTGMVSVQLSAAWVKGTAARIPVR